MFGKKQNRATPPAQEGSDRDEYVVSVTDTRGNTTQYIGATRAERDRMVKSLRDRRDVADHTSWKR